MAPRAILAVDEGSTNSKAVLVDQDGAILASGSVPVPTHYPQSGWVEQDAGRIWDSTLGAIRDCLAKRPDVQIVALGLSNQRESVLAWHRRTGAPLGPVVTWQCRRTAPACAHLKAEGHEPEILKRTGLPLDPLFPATKLKWLLDTHCTGVAPQDICVGTVDSWLIWKFSGGTVHATDSSNAARTQLFNLDRMEWDSALSDLFDVPLAVLPQVLDSSHVFGHTNGVPGMTDGIPIASAIGDSHGALFGHGAFRAGDGKVTFGTGSSVMTTVSEFVVPPTGVTTTVAWSLNGTPTYALEGNILVSASILPWTANLLGLPDVAELLELAKSVESSDGVCLVPAHVGLGSPHWNANARGLMSGLTFTSGPAEIARAAVESIALQVHDVFDIIATKDNGEIGQLFVDGGPSQNPFIMSLVADYLEHPVITCENTEASALGAAHLAGLAVGVWPDLAALEGLKTQRATLNASIDGAKRQKTLQRWHAAVARSTLET